MRAREFVMEVTKGKLHRDQASAMPKAHKFAGTADRIYDLHRAMMAVAGADGSGSLPHHHTDEESWIGRNNMANPYTEVEHKMLHDAYKTIGIDIEDAVSSHSQEPDSSHKVSPVKPFKGYPR